MMDTAELQEVVEAHPYPLLFVTVSGAHLYGFPSPDSDYDLRGAHVLPLTEVIGLDVGAETVERSEVHASIPIDVVTHDVRKFLLLLLKRNGYVLEQLTSPLVVQTTPEHEELRAMAPRCITRHHCHHYLGFAQNQWRLFLKESPRRVKPLLYVYRVLMTGIHLLRTGEVEANLVRLNALFRLSHVAELVARKQSGAEQAALGDEDVAFHESEYQRLCRELEDAATASHLPDRPSGRDALNDLLVRVRLSPQASHRGSNW